MSRTPLLLDSNSYFRLARSFHPLLDNEFGNPRYCLYVITDLDKEFRRSERLRNKFPWVSSPEYCLNRKKRIQLSRAESSQVNNTFSYIAGHAKSHAPGVSPVDLRALSLAHVKVIQLVTDDQDMHRLATDFEIKVMKTLELVRLMMNCGHVSESQVIGLVEYWKYEKDLPANFSIDFALLFGEPQFTACTRV